MAIEYKYGATPTLKLAEQVGIERQRQIQQARADDIRKQQMAQQFQIESEMRTRAWELEKMELNSRQDFQMQQLREQAHFQRELAKELKEKDELEAGLKAIQNSPIFSEKDKELASIQLKTRGTVPAYTQAELTERKAIKPTDLIEEYMLNAFGGGFSAPNFAEPGGFSQMPLPSPRTPKEKEELPSGSRYIAPDGSIRVKK